MGAFIKNFLLNLLNTRLYWLCVIMISVAFEYCGYYFQYVEELKPCELCVYERAAFAAIGLIGFLVIFWPKGLKYIGIPLWIYASCMGLSIAIEHVDAESNIFATCNFIYSVVIIQRFRFYRRCYNTILLNRKLPKIHTGVFFSVC